MTEITRQCTAHRAGHPTDRCRNAAIKGGNVCRNHGGGAPQVQQAARERLFALVEPAMAALCRVISAPEGACPLCGRSDDMSVVVKAAQIVLDRTGFHPTQTIAVTRPRADLTKLSDAELRQRFVENASRLGLTFVDPTVVDVEAQELPALAQGPADEVATMPTREDEV